MSRIENKKMKDQRPVVTLHQFECRHCNWSTPIMEEADLPAMANAESTHGYDTGHREFWHYTIQRGQATLYFLPLVP